MKRIIAILLGAATGLLTAAGPEGRSKYTVVGNQSKMEIHVYREGFLKAFGHDHLISPTHFSGEVALVQPDIKGSSVAFTVETSSMTVLDPGESEKDRKEVQATMLGEKVLDATRYPRIWFVSSAIRSVTQKDGKTELQVEGSLNLHGVQKQVTVPIQLRADNGRLSADGEVSLSQSEYGIVPIKVGGGAVRVKDKLKISFHIVARKDGAAE